METMAASSKTSVSEEAESKANEAMDTNSSRDGSRGEKSMDASYTTSSLRESTENSVSSPGRESRSEGDNCEQFTGEQTEELLVSDPWEEKIVESNDVGAVSSRSQQKETIVGPTSEAVEYNQAFNSSSHGRDLNQEEHADTTGNEEIGEAGSRFRKLKYLDTGDTELDAPGALLQATFTERSSQKTSLTTHGENTVEACETVEMSHCDLEQTKNPIFDIYSELPMNNEAVHLGGLPRIIHTDINPRLVAPVTSMGAAASSSGSGSIQGKSKPSAALRRGKWTVEEEAYVARVIQDFNSGFLDAPAGTTLRSYLSEKLHCDPMRITKKFTGDACIGKRVFHPAARCTANATSIDKAQAELNALERRWRRRLEMQQRESAKKAAASAAAFAAGRGPGSVGPVPTLRPSGSSASLQQQVQQSVVARTASWLERANSILQGNDGLTPSASAPELGIDSGLPLPKSEIMNQMKEVQRLIYEGPIIQQTTAGIAGILDQDFPHLASSNSVETGDPGQLELKQAVEPADKRMRRTSMNSTGAEDAEALVGFLRSVRASAASEEFSG